MSTSCRLTTARCRTDLFDDQFDANEPQLPYLLLLTKCYEHLGLVNVIVNFLLENCAIKQKANALDPITCAT